MNTELGSELEVSYDISDFKKQTSIYETERGTQVLDQSIAVTSFEGLTLKNVSEVVTTWL